MGSAGVIVRPGFLFDSEYPLVMPGLVPGIHVLLLGSQEKTWMAGTSRAMTVT
jgi:hypothetical protein